MDSILLIVLALALIVGVAMLAGVGILHRERSGLDKAYFAKQWKRVESFKASGDAGWQLAIIEADKLLDHALKSKGYGGQTMADRMKHARQAWRNADAVWSAHKLRNRLAHEQNVQLNIITVNKALKGFKSALNDLGAL